MTSDIMFEEFPKIARLRRECVITEKIDGTNAQILIGEDGSVRAGSRNRFLTLDADNFGFARWVKDHEEELRGLGPGRHFGEWWGAGIQRRYGLTEKRFSLFNVSRWADEARPACCHVVPTLVRGIFSTMLVEAAVDDLRMNGSKAAPGFGLPEGIVVWHDAARQMFKVTLEKDEEPKRVTRDGPVMVAELRIQLAAEQVEAQRLLAALEEISQVGDSCARNIARAALEADRTGGET